MHNVDPAEIPMHGERYNMTLTEAAPQDRDKQVVTIKAIIDSGDYAPHTVGDSFRAGGKMLHLFAKNIGITLPEFTGDNWQEYLGPLRQVRMQARFSAVLYVSEFETKRKRGVSYGLTFFEAPTAKADIRLRKEPTQFKR